jgi:hypothetical protein
VIESIGTYLPPWGTSAARRVGDDEDVVTMAVAAGIQALDAAPHVAVARVVLVSRDVPLLEGGNPLDIEDKAAARELRGHCLQIAAQQLRIEHGEVP